MGGRGSDSGMNRSVGKGARELGLTSREIDRLTDTAIDFIKKQERIYGSLTPGREKDFRDQIKKEYNAGFSGLEEGRVLDISTKNPNAYLIKRGEKAVSVFKTGNNTRIGKEYELSETQKKTYLRRAILLRLRPRRM